MFKKLKTKKRPKNEIPGLQTVTESYDFGDMKIEVKVTKSKVHKGGDEHEDV